MKKFLATLLVSALAFGPAPSAFADTQNWDGGGNDGLWATTTNWHLDAAVPGTGNNATFNAAAGGGGAIINLGAGITIGSIVFDLAAAAAYTIGSAAGQQITFNNGGGVVVNNGVVQTQTIAANVILADNATFTNNGANDAFLLNVTGNVTGGAAGTLTLNGSDTGANIVSGIISDGSAPLAVTKAEAGTWHLSGVNTYTGATTINAGTLDLDRSLTASSGINFTGAGTLTIADNANITPAITTTGNGQGTVTTEGTTTFAGAIGTSVLLDLAAINVNGVGESVTFGRNVFSEDLVQGAANTINIGANTVTLGDDLTMNAAGTLGLTINSGTSFGNIQVADTATIAATNVINVNLAGVIANGSTFTVVNAVTDAITGNPTVTDNSAFFNFTAAENGTVDLVLTANSNAAAVAQTGNASNVLAAVDSAVVGGASGDFTTAINSLYAISGLQAASDAVETLDPDATGGNVEGTQAITDQFMGGVSNRLGFARSALGQTGVSTGDMFQGSGFWLQGLGSHGDQDARKGSAGYAYDAFGVALGADKLVSDHLRVGLAAGYGRTGIDSKALGNAQTDVNSWSGSIYTSYDSTVMGRDAEGGPKESISPEDDSFYVDTIAAFTYHDYDSSRNIALGALNRTAEADFGGQQYSFKAETGYTIRTEATRALETTPFLSLGYSYLHMNSYSEKGAGALNLTVDGEGYHALDQALGMRFAYPMVCNKTGITFIPAVKAAWLYDYIGDRVETKSTFAGGGSSFTTKGAEPAQSGFLVGAELALVNVGNLTLTANWDMELRDEYLSNTYGGTARFEF